MPGTYCIKCFQPLNGSGVCPHCGCDNSAYQPKAFCLPAGVRLHGRYAVGQVLGEGGFGITYAGFDTKLERRVAIKEYFPAGCVNRDAGRTLQVTCSEAEDMRTVFEEGKRKALQEARSLAQLDDVGDIVRVLDFFPENQTAYIIMEYVEGVTLRSYVRERGGKMPCEEVVELLTPVMRAMKDIHARGFVHRDISPDNIMVTAGRGQVKLLDFGAVKVLGEEGGGYTQNVIVKRGFSPLELYSTEDLIGPWSDVYAMCATVFFLVCGEKPQDPVDRLNNDAVPAALEAYVSPRYAEVLLKGLAVQEDRRYRDMGELLTALEDVQNAPVYFTPPQIADPENTMIGVPNLFARQIDLQAAAREGQIAPNVSGHGGGQRSDTGGRTGGGVYGGGKTANTAAKKAKQNDTGTVAVVAMCIVLCLAAVALLLAVILPRLHSTEDETVQDSTEAAAVTAEVPSYETDTDYRVKATLYLYNSIDDYKAGEKPLRMLTHGTVHIIKISTDENPLDETYRYWGEATYVSSSNREYIGWVSMYHLVNGVEDASYNSAS